MINFEHFGLSKSPRNGQHPFPANPIPPAQFNHGHLTNSFQFKNSSSVIGVLINSPIHYSLLIMQQLVEVSMRDFKGFTYPPKFCAQLLPTPLGFSLALTPLHGGVLGSLSFTPPCYLDSRSSLVRPSYCHLSQ